MAIPTMTANSPGAGSIAWGAFTIQYMGTAYSIGAGSTSHRWVWWRYNGGGVNSIIEAGPDIPADLTDDDLVLFGNKNGIPVRIQSTSFVDGELLVDGSVLAQALAADAVTAEHLKANNALIDALNTQDLSTVNLAAVKILSAFIQIGQATWDEEDGLVIPQPNGGFIKFPVDGSAATVAAHLIAYSLSISGLTTMDGGASLRSAFQIKNGLTAPDAAIATTAYKWPLQTAMVLPEDPGPIVPTHMNTLCDSVDGTEWIHSTLGEGQYAIVRRSKSTGVSVFQNPGLPAGTLIYGLTRIGSNYYALTFLSGVGYSIVKYSSTWSIVSNVALGVSSLPNLMFSNDGTNPIYGTYGSQAGGTWPVTIYSINPTTGVRTQVFTKNVSVEPRAIAAGVFDHGSMYYALYEKYGMVRTYTPGGSELLGSEFSTPLTSNNQKTLYWDGTRFWALGHSAQIYKFSKQKTDVANISIKYPWTDGTYQTDLSPAKTATHYKRTFMEFQIPAAPPSPAGLYAKVYMNDKLQTAVTPLSPTQRTFLLDDYNASGAAPVANPFPNITPGQLATEAGGWSVDGKGDGSIGTGSFRASVRDAGYDPTVMHRCVLKKNAQQTLTDNVNALLAWQLEDVDVGGLGNVAGNSIVIQRDGLYSITGAIQTDNIVAAGILAATITVDDISVGHNSTHGQGSASNALNQCSATVPAIWLTAGDIVKLEALVWGGNVTVETTFKTTNNPGTWLEVIQIR